MPQEPSGSDAGAEGSDTISSSADSEEGEEKTEDASAAGNGDVSTASQDEG